MFVNDKHCIVLRYARTCHCISMELFTMRLYQRSASYT